jgi:hypothetical protein
MAGSRCVVEDYLGCFISYKPLQNAAIVVPVPLILSSPPKMEKLKELGLEVNTTLFTASGVVMFTFVCED